MATDDDLFKPKSAQALLGLVLGAWQTGAPVRSNRASPGGLRAFLAGIAGVPPQIPAGLSGRGLLGFPPDPPDFKIMTVLGLSDRCL